MELRRVNILKRFYSRKATSLSYLNQKLKNLATIHSIDEAFVQGGNIKINKKAMVHFNEDQKRKQFTRTLTKQLNLKKKYFKRTEESPEEMKRYFRAKLRNNGLWFKKKIENTFKKIRACIQKIIL